MQRIYSCHINNRKQNKILFVTIRRLVSKVENYTHSIDMFFTIPVFINYTTQNESLKNVWKALY